MDSGGQEATCSVEREHSHFGGYNHFCSRTKEIELTHHAD
jgi:hypothetical protein